VQLNVIVHDIKHWSPPADQRANQYQHTRQWRHLWHIGLCNWGLLKGCRAPAPSQCTLRMLELLLLRNHPWKVLFKTQLNEQLWTQVINTSMSHLSSQYYIKNHNMLISWTDLSPILIKSAVKSYLTTWCIQNLSGRALNRHTVSTSTATVLKVTMRRLRSVR